MSPVGFPGNQLPGGLVVPNIDKTVEQELKEIKEQLAILTTPVLFSGPGGSLVLKTAGEVKPLVAGPEVTVTTTGIYLVTIGMRLRIGAAGGLVSMQGGLAVGGVASSLFCQYVASGAFDLYLAETTSKFTLNAGEKLSTYGEISQSVECIFDFSRIICRRIS